MQIRDNIRRRRHARIAELLEVESEKSDAKKLPERKAPSQETLILESGFTPASGSATQLATERQEQDPELWWKQQQKRLNRAAPSWQGVGGLSATEPPNTDEPRAYWLRILSGFAIRTLVSAMLFGIVWIWFQSEMPGSREARVWTVNAVSHDMDFQAALSWYERNFGGSPAFLPMFRAGETKAVFGGWKRSEAVLPVAGRIVRTFAQDRQGIRIAAVGGSIVQAVYAGRVIRVEDEVDGRAAVEIQHAGRIVTVYGNLSQAAVQPNDWVEAGQTLGTVPVPIDDDGESLLYFAVRDDNRAIDPMEVVPFD